MASKIEKQYIDNLKTFTDALGDIVDTLKSQSDKDNIDVLNNYFKTPMDDLKNVVNELKTVTEKGFKNLVQNNTDLVSKIVDNIKSNDIDFTPINNITNAVNQLAEVTSKGFNDIKENYNQLYKSIEKISTPNVSNNDMSDIIGSLIETIDDGFTRLYDENFKITEVVNNINKKSSTIDEIKTGNDDIIAKIDSIKQEKESGFFEKIEDPKNKNKIVDGIKTVALIAGGVLAIGMAFKLIGGVNFVSVIALSGAMYMIAKSFSQIAELKNMKYTEILKVSAMLPIMAAALTTSSWIIKATPDISIKQGLSLLYVGLYMGIASHFLLKEIQKIDFESQFKNIISLPILLPIIAISLTTSAWILKAFPILNAGQGMSLFLVGSALGVTSHILLSSLKNIDLTKQLKNVLMLPLLLPAIAIGLTLSGYILKSFPEFGLKQSLSILLIGGTLGIASWIIVKAFDKVKAKDFPTLLSLPILLPAIALALTASAWILKGFPEFSLKQGLSILFLGAALGASTWLLLKGFEKIKTSDFNKIMMMPILLPIISMAIVASAWILTDFPYISIKKGLSILLGSGVIGLSLLMFTPVIKIIGQMKLKDAAMGLVAIPLIATSIVSAALIFNLLPNEMKYPEMKWSANVGLSFLAFVPVLYVVGKMSLKDAAMGLVAIPLIATTIVASAWIFSLLPNDMKYPEMKWTLGAGLSMLAFGGMAIGLGLMLTGPQALLAAAGLVGILAISATVVGVSHILNKGKFDNYPSLNWALGVGGSLLAFSLASIVALGGGVANMIGKFFNKGEDPLVKVAKSMNDVANKLNEVDWNNAKHPTKEYAEGVGGLLLAFAEVFAKISKVEGFNKIVSSLFGGGGDTFMTFINNASDAMISVHDKLNGINWKSSKHPSKDYAEGVGGFLESLANAFASISKINGLNNIIGGGISFNDFVKNSAQSMIIANEILSTVSWSKSNYPSKEYAEGVGGFLNVMADAYSKMNSKGFLSSIGDLFSGDKKQSLHDFVIEASTALVDASKILANGNYTTKFEKDYVENFSNIMIEMSKITELKNLKVNEDFSKFSLDASTSISTASKALGEGDYTNIPDSNYTSSFSKFIKTYSKLAEKGYNVQDFENFDKSLSVIIESANKITLLPEINESMLENMKNYSKILAELGTGVDKFMHETPSGIAGKVGSVIVGKKKRDMTEFSSFSTSISTLLSSFKILSELKPMQAGIMDGYKNFLNEFGKLPDMTMLDPKIESINKLANSFATLANSLMTVNDNLEGFTNLSKGLFLISVIDDKKFNNVLQTVDKYKGSLNVINDIPKEKQNILSTIDNLTKTANSIESGNSVVTESTVKEKQSVVSDNSQQTQFYKDVSDIRSLLYEFRDLLDKPTQAGSFK